MAGAISSRPGCGSGRPTILSRLSPAQDGSGYVRRGRRTSPWGRGRPHPATPPPSSLSGRTAAHRDSLWTSVPRLADKPALRSPCSGGAKGSAVVLVFLSPYHAVLGIKGLATVTVASGTPLASQPLTPPLRCGFWSSGNSAPKIGDSPCLTILTFQQPNRS